MAHQPIRDNIVEPLIPKNDDFSISKFTKVCLWLISLTAAISSHHTFKATNFYKHFNLQHFDHETLIPIAIILVHAVFAFMTRVRYLIEMRGPNEPHYLIRFSEAMLQLYGTLLMNVNVQLLNDEPMIISAAMFSIFLMCFLRLVAPGYGWKLPFIPAAAAACTAYQVSRLVEFVPLFIAFFTVSIIFLEHDEHIVKRQKQLHS